MEQVRFRHELKYAIPYGEYLALRARLRRVMRPDPHVKPGGRYRTRSIYFDNSDDKALREKVDGVPRREKFRIRFYNDDLSFFHLEKKMKLNSLCRKVDAPLTQGECMALLSGDWAWMKAHPSELVRELYAKLYTQRLRPRVMVSYLREPYIYPAGNVRVTFDWDIRTSLFRQDFLRPQAMNISASDTPQDRILEVKYDAFLPEVIQHILQTPGLRQQAFSKYGYCRRFG